MGWEARAVIPDWLQLAAVIASPAFAAGGAYIAVRVNLEWLRRDVDRAHERIDETVAWVQSKLTLRMHR